MATLPVAVFPSTLSGLRRLIGTRVISSLTSRKPVGACQGPMAHAMIVQMTSIMVPPRADLSSRISAKGNAMPLR